MCGEIRRFFVSVKYNIDLSKKAADEIIASVEYRTVYGSRGKYTRESETVREKEEVV